ncbi:calcium-binding protein P-like [Haliotis rubra]|uniref:calcium-binding protein P-like n=1 Tax=Haliotis rubra TaxID=36100 RepID=UPI001EE4FFB9|nr:calcium-binding protein P-like [Haliotis rubra]XP_048254814.1 calcium-binding protein P-like [Haliotis rufescens]
MNYHHSHTGSIPPGSSFPSSSDKPGLYTAGGFTTSPYPPSQPGLPPGAQTQRYQSVTQAYAMAANPAYYTPPTGYSTLSATGYPSATVGTGAFHTVGYPSLQSLPSTTPAGYPTQYPMPTYLGGSQLGATTVPSYAASALPVTSAIYPSSAYTSTPIVASQIQPRGYSVSPMGYPSQLGTNPTYPGASYQSQPPF